VDIELELSGAISLVASMTTEKWAEARDRFADLLGQRAGDVEAQAQKLDSVRAQVVAVGAVSDVVREWRSRFRRMLDRELIDAQLFARLAEEYAPTTQSPHEGFGRRFLWVLESLGHVLVELDRPEAALDAYRQVAAIYQAVGDQSGEARALDGLGSVLFKVFRPDEALDAYRRAVAIYQEVGDRPGEARALENLGLALGELHRPEEAINVYRRLATNYQEVRDELGEARALESLGVALVELNRPEEALNAYRRVAAIYVQVEDELGEARALESLGPALVELDRTEEAINVYYRLAAIYRKFDERSNQATVLESLGRFLAELHRHEEALEVFQRAVDLADQTAYQNFDTLRISVYLTNEEDEGRARAALSRYLDAIRGLVSEETSPVRGSLRWSARAKKRAAEVGESASVIAETLAWSPVRTRAAADNLTNSQAVLNIREAMKDMDDCIIQVGSLLAVKHGRVIAIVTLSQAQLNLLERCPHLLTSPGTILNELGRLDG
jgi:tetratricopeptide (TPR) repeat protein